ncbi:glycosyltransferase [Halobacillus rhizosphaerae]|uniref:glycosyltransferase n=1 Tax=Halobacillus rhizosphaerae TaxID=3064889 RepID=UPI00398A7CF1
MKILYIVAEFPKLSETFILNQITGLIDKGHTVTILASSFPKEEKTHPDVSKYNLNNRVVYFNLPKSKIIRVLKFLIKFLPNFIKGPVKTIRSLNVFKYKKFASSFKLFYCKDVLKKKQKFDVIHSHFGDNGILAVYLKDIGLLEGNINTTFHGNDMTAYVKKNGNEVYNELFYKGNSFTPISEYWKNRLIELGCNEDKINVHRMGVDLKRFTFSVKKYSSNDISIISVARLVEKKGIEYSIKAISILINKGININYTIVGDGPLRPYLQQLIDDLGIGNYVKIAGWRQQTELIELLTESHLLMVPSVTSRNGDMEGIPVVIMESMAMGLPVLSTYHSGIPEIIEDNKTGFLVGERNILSISEKLTYIIDSPDIVVDVAKNARKKVERNYNIDIQNSNLEKIFKGII